MSVASSCGVTDRQRLRPGAGTARGTASGLVLHVDALHRRTRLTGERERRARDALGGEVEIRVGLDDHRRRVAELERDVLARRAVAQHPADRRRAGEGDHRDPRILEQHVADLRLGAEHDVEPAGREAGLDLELGQRERAQRRLRSGFEDDRAAGRERRRDLVSDQVGREVERSDRRDDARSACAP